MQVKSKRCGICLAWSNKTHCPVCGAIKIGKKTYNVENMKELVRGMPIPYEQLVSVR